MAMLRKDVEQNRKFQSAMFRQMEEENAELRRKIKVMEGTVEMAIPVENDLRAEIYNPKYQVETLLVSLFKSRHLRHPLADHVPSPGEIVKAGWYSWDSPRSVVICRVQTTKVYRS